MAHVDDEFSVFFGLVRNWSVKFSRACHELARARVKSVPRMDVNQGAIN